LRESGARVLAKTTGSKPVLIFPDGSEREILRAGPASIREQVRLIRMAAATGADTLVSEMMSVGAECLAAESRRILRPGTLALTNVRFDHLDEMGRRKDDIARSLASAFPERADIFIPKEEIYPVFEEAAARTASRLHPVAPLAPVAGPGASPRLSFGEFEPNARLALAVLASLGVERKTAERGVAAASPDFGSLRAWRGRFGDPPRPAVCVSAFAANDPESSAAALSKIGREFPSHHRDAGGNSPHASRRWVGLLSLREDRGDRTLQWVRSAHEGFFRDFARVVLIGPPARAALRRIRKSPLPGGTVFSVDDGSSPQVLMDRVVPAAPGEPVIIGLGNIVGPGERLVRLWEEKGTPHDR
ncbi:MAG: poly-gamma-glutamate synthase PgsB, partial [Acidobacteria bacterium]|nr:poly-gamma-glutamate synthase PgsB [Acidobacteriota bacterium]